MALTMPDVPESSGSLRVLALPALPDIPAPKARRGTTNRNDRGSSYDRERRRKWLVETYRANQDLLITKVEIDGQTFDHPIGVWPDYNPAAKPACRCYRCGVLLTVETVTVDRIVPGCQGGTYRRNNIRPACGTCNSETGGALACVPKKRGKR